MVRSIGAFLFLAIALSSCNVYNRNIMFRTQGTTIYDSLAHSISQADSSYVLQPYDNVTIRVYVNNGELLIDPTFEVRKQMGMMVNQGGMMETFYTIRPDGKANLPVIGETTLLGLTLKQADSTLKILYEGIYNDVYVITRVANKRVFVFGTAGGVGSSQGLVIPLTNENMTVIEILALAGGLDRYARTDNIRLIRGDLKNPNVYVIDLTTIEGMRQANLNVQPNDIIYVERQRKILLQTLQELTPFMSLVTSLIALTVVLSR